MRLSAPVKAAAQRLTLPFLIFVSALFAVLGKADILLFDHARDAAHLAFDAGEAPQQNLTVRLRHRLFLRALAGRPFSRRQSRHP